MVFKIDGLKPILANEKFIIVKSKDHLVKLTFNADAQEIEFTPVTDYGAKTNK